jgi:hypothetical protein
MISRPHVIVHSLEHARAAVAEARLAGTPVTLESPCAAAGSLGIGWWRELVAAVAADDVEAALDCGSAPGHALEAVRAGIKTVRLAAPPEVFDRVADIARQAGAAVLPPLDADGWSALPALPPFPGSGKGG